MGRLGARTLKSSARVVKIDLLNPVNQDERPFLLGVAVSFTFSSICGILLMYQNEGEVKWKKWTWLC